VASAFVVEKSHFPPDEIAESPHNQFLIDTWQGGTAYSREISAADQKFILRQYRAYGEPKPPPIDHNGIDDAFLEKASITWYWHNGKWVQLQGQTEWLLSHRAGQQRRLTF
jgi:hypothetical protein